MTDYKQTDISRLFEWPTSVNAAIAQSSLFLNIFSSPANIPC